MKVHQALRKIESGEWKLPHFQRDYVWTHKKRLALFRTCIDRYPRGSILAWAPKRRSGLSHIPFDIHVPEYWSQPKRIPEVFVLDGQQRLSTLFQQYWLGKTKSDRTKIWPRLDGRHIKVLCVNLKDKDKALKWIAPKKASATEGCIHEGGWVEIPELLSSRYSGDFRLEIKEQLGIRAAERGLDVRTAILDSDLLQEEMPRDATLTQAVEAFERINSEGTKLGIVDIAAIHLFEKYKELGRDITRHSVDLQSHPSNPTEHQDAFSSFNRTILLRSLFFNLFGTSDPTKANEIAKSRNPSEAKIKREWKKVKSAYADLNKFLGLDDLNLITTSGVPSQYLMVAAQFFVNPKLRRNIEEKNKLKHWLFLSCIGLPYTGGSTNKNVDRDLKYMDKDRPWSGLHQTLKTEGGFEKNLQLESKHLGIIGEEPVPHNGILAHLAYLCAHYDGACDWITRQKIPASRVAQRTDRWDRHHIFQKCNMRTSDKKLVNHFANMAWITQGTNRGAFRKALPKKYLPEVIKDIAGEKILQAQCVPTNDLSLYNIGKFKSFLQKRTDLLVDQMNKTLKAWKGGSEPNAKPPLSFEASLKVGDLVAKGEGQRVEFKSTFSFNTKTGQRDDQLKQACLRAIASFANSGGGWLLVGVDDSGRPLGLSKEKALHSQELEIVVRQYIENETDPPLEEPQNISITIEKYQRKEVLKVQVRGSSEKVFRTRKRANKPQDWVYQERHGNQSSRPEVRQ